ncbi:putative deoxyribonuclease TATDN3 [Physella acuta]|uniref:putative deoxyribonuclease TATDN3 n=1 Tax=Physella acuta TaxID=109671 RepID=UPI0027DEA4E8|nr:putative deoxyribonuclease TATDN3 [Physella acuta]XP_059161114.1 putative deoxyribonuclease TATDN3 [Physella acuta]XP_059161115.1 putative deoxyribonuclease TATDN3 [Physella acuta]XP_059161116.1 putative deoxyribonuclease TATDN3 [Physella acuta]
MANGESIAVSRRYTQVVDAHAHLTNELLIGDIDNIIARALVKHVAAALVVTENLKDFEHVIDLYRSFPRFVVPCLGIHPIQCSGTKDDAGIEIMRSVILNDYEGVEESIEDNLDIIGGIGEIGLDFTPRFCQKPDDKEIQTLILTKQVQLADRHRLPINVHSRSAGRKAIQLLKELGAQNVLLHAFDGRASVALEGASNGFYFSVPSSVCRDTQIQKMVKALPLDKLLVETDAPCISPVKGTVNEPANAMVSIEYISKIKKIHLEYVKTITTENAVRLFPKLKDIL